MNLKITDECLHGLYIGFTCLISCTTNECFSKFDVLGDTWGLLQPRQQLVYLHDQVVGTGIRNSRDISVDVLRMSGAYGMLKQAPMNLQMSLDMFRTTSHHSLRFWWNFCGPAMLKLLWIAGNPDLSVRVSTKLLPKQPKTSPRSVIPVVLERRCDEFDVRKGSSK